MHAVGAACYTYTCLLDLMGGYNEVQYILAGWGLSACPCRCWPSFVPSSLEIMPLVTGEIAGRHAGHFEHIGSVKHI